MGLFSKLFETRVETRDDHPDQRLRTRYYKTTKSKLFQACQDWITKENALTLIGQSEERGELAANVKGKRKGLLVLTIVSTNPFKTALDLSFSVDSGLNAGYGQALSNRLFTQIDQLFDRL